MTLEDRIIADLDRTHPWLQVCNCRICGRLLCSRKTATRIREAVGVRAVANYARTIVGWEVHTIPLCANTVCLIQAAKQFPKPPEDVGRDDFDLEDVA